MICAEDEWELATNMTDSLSARRDRTGNSAANYFNHDPTLPTQSDSPQTVSTAPLTMAWQGTLLHTLLLQA
jgi:hypothetical protein